MFTSHSLYFLLSHTVDSPPPRALRDRQVQSHRGRRPGERGGPRRVGEVEVARGVLVVVSPEAVQVLRVR